MTLQMMNRLKDSLKTLEGDWYESKLTRHDHFDVLGRIDDALNRLPRDFAVEDWRRLMASCLGHFMTMHRWMKFSGGVIHRLLMRELHHEGPIDKIWFLLGNHLMRFSKVEFYLITGLRFGVVPDTIRYEVVGNDIHQWYFGGIDEVSFEELRVVLTIEEFQEAYLVYMLNWLLMGLDKRFKIPVWKFLLVKDLDAFDAFP
ncbi:hypothetical protein Ddye_028131 [Dipteronia dyeriana]|uniref:DUF1985 domain-containing protein n=1 Tax=Dipteronia dyeriana TaxID=168575 RepID=A0AAD9WR51_9ROSI|nr:hypothetical protein Ddye_028131 [Dipteronia dyeriana]